MEKRTKEDIEALKQLWLSDPIWDIEDSEGFEAHREELRAFRLEKEKARMHEKSVEIGCPGNLKLVDYIEVLEYRIDRLADRLLEIEEKC